MATKSFQKNVRVDDRSMVRGLVNALEHAEKKSAKTVELSRPLTEVRGDGIKSLFGVKNECERI